MPEKYSHSYTNIFVAAKELGYSNEVMKLLKAAKTEAEQSRIMHDARLGKYDKPIKDVTSDGKAKTNR